MSPLTTLHKLEESVIGSSKENSQNIEKYLQTFFQPENIVLVLVTPNSDDDDAEPIENDDSQTNTLTTSEP